MQCNFGEIVWFLQDLNI